MSLTMISRLTACKQTKQTVIRWYRTVDMLAEFNSLSHKGQIKLGQIERIDEYCMVSRMPRVKVSCRQKQSRTSLG